MLNKWINKWIYLQWDLRGCWPNCKTLQPFSSPWWYQKRKATEEEGKRMTGRQLAAWFFVWGGLQAGFPSQLCLVSLHAGSGLCRSRLLHTASAQALQRVVSFLISARWVDNMVHETLDSPSFRFCVFFLAEEYIHIYFVKGYAGFFWWFCCYSRTESNYPEAGIFPG